MENRNRLFFIDNLRIALIALVVAHHVGQAYGMGGWWYFESAERTPWLGTFFTINRSFFMSLFFMISGYFIPASYNRKGPREFIKGRFVRLGIPLLAFFFVIIPIMTYAYYLNFRAYGPISFRSYYLDIYFGAGEKLIGWSGPSWPDMQFGHLWFVEHLLLFAIGYTIWRAIWKGSSNDTQNQTEFPGNIAILGFAIGLAMVTYIVRIWYPIDKWVGFLGFIQVAFADVPRDLSFFVIGVMAYHRDWFQKVPTALGRIWQQVGVVAISVYVTLSISGISIYGNSGETLIYILWETLLCFGMCIGLVVLFRERINNRNEIGAKLAAVTYAVYLFHVPVVVILQYSIGSANISPFVKFILVTIVGIPLTFLIGSFLRRVPGWKNVL